MNSYLLYSSFALYLMAGFSYLLQLIFNNHYLCRIALRLTVVGWCIHSFLMGWLFYQAKAPFLINAGISYLFTAWVFASVFLLLNIKQRLQLSGAMVLPTVATFYLLAIFSTSSYEDSALYSPWASIHLILMFLALAIFSFSFIWGLLFIIEEFQLKHKVLPKIFLKLPSLEDLEKNHAKALTIGFILLTGGIITGAGWAKSVKGFYFFDDPRQLWSICAWLIYALFLQGRFAAGWRGRKSVLLSLLGFVVILFTFLGVEHG